MLDETAFVGRRVCVVGNINRDLRTAPVPAGDNLFQDGETSTAFIRETLGGGAANSALAAAGLGADVRLVGKIGEDRTGYHLEAVLAAHNVRPFLTRDDDHPTGTSINLVFDNGHRHFVSSLPSSATLTYEDVDPAALQGCKHLLRAEPSLAQESLYRRQCPLLIGAESRPTSLPHRRAVLSDLPSEVVKKSLVLHAPLPRFLRELGIVRKRQPPPL